MIARVVPDIPSFSLDHGFRYSVPEGLRVGVGSIVRVPLAGRTVRGYVIGIEPGEDQDLKEIRSRSGEVDIFDPQLLETVRWASHYYVAPLASLIHKTAPPNLPKISKRPPAAIDIQAEPVGRIGELAATIRGERRRNVFLQAPSLDELSHLVESVGAAGHSSLLIGPTATEVERLASFLRERIGSAVIEVSPSGTDAEVTSAWNRVAMHGGYVLVGSPRIALWPVAGLRMAIIVGEGRRALKDRQTPTVHARDLMLSRSRVERFTLISTGLIPSTDLVTTGAEILDAPGRPWSLIEFVDRGEDPPGTGVFSDRTKHAIAGAVRRGQSVFLFTHRHGYAPAYRCAACRALRSCSECGSRAGREGFCVRCETPLGRCEACGSDRFEPLGAGVGRVAEMAGRIVDRERVGMVGQGRQVSVGTVRDLPQLSRIELAVVVDADGLILGTNYRAAEDAFHSLARVARAVGSGSGRRTLIQTADPHHRVLTALARGRWADFVMGELETRSSHRFPPQGDLIVVECTELPGAPADIRERFVGTDVHGPAAIDRGYRWLIQSEDLTKSKATLRDLAREWRDSGAKVRIDVDPIDL